MAKIIATLTLEIEEECKDEDQAIRIVDGKVQKISQFVIDTNIEEETEYDEENENEQD